MGTDVQQFNQGVVLIDDDPMAHYIFKALVKLYGPELRYNAFLNPLEVIELIANDSFKASAIILDINMPKMTGWEFLTELKKINYKIPVYMLTSSSDMKDKMRVKEFDNVRGYFVKPLTQNHLKVILDAPH